MGYVDLLISSKVVFVITFNFYLCTFNYQASLAQLVEQFIRNEQVGGSSPLRGSKILSQGLSDLRFYPGSVAIISRRKSFTLKFFRL